MRRCILIILALFVFSTTTSPEELSGPDLNQIQQIFYHTVTELNGAGRLPLSGVLGGFANNFWQTVSRPSDPTPYGCAGQTTFLYHRLTGLKLTGWQFDERYEFGTDSPIFLPHQWVTAYGVNGQIVELDPWLNQITVRNPR